MSTKKIIWEPQSLQMNPAKQNISWENDDYDEEEDFEDEFEPNTIMQAVPIQNVTATPFGMWKVNDDMHPMKQFKLWMGHTNFDLTEGIVRSIEKIVGVELLRIISRYRFIVGIGKAFDSEDIKYNIEKDLCGIKYNKVLLNKIKCEEARENVESVINELIEEDGEWIVIVLPNGNCNYINKQNAKTYQKDKNFLIKAAEISDSLIIESLHEPSKKD